MTTAGLFALDKLPAQATYGRALEPLRLDRCPQCAGALWTDTMLEPALFIHGGYGADRYTETLRCARTIKCGWALRRAVSETNPRRR